MIRVTFNEIKEVKEVLKDIDRYSRSDIEDKLKDILINNNNLNYLLDSNKDYKNINQNLRTINF